MRNCAGDKGEEPSCSKVDSFRLSLSEGECLKSGLAQKTADPVGGQGGEEGWLLELEVVAGDV